MCWMYICIAFRDGGESCRGHVKMIKLQREISYLGGGVGSHVDTKPRDAQSSKLLMKHS
jgi:hypothetical protein